MRFRNRVSGVVVHAAPDPILFGQWIVDGADRINDHPAGRGDALVPDATGGWSVSARGAPVAQGRFWAGTLPGEQDIEALLDLGRKLKNREESGSGWLGWVGTSPLAPGLDQAVRRHILEDRIEEELTHLEQVCKRPRRHIRVETKRVLAGRARRLARRAPAWLASHTEDWERRRILDVQPRRVLAQVREELWNLYENRLTARLIDNLLAWTRRRIGEVRRVLDEILIRLANLGVETHANRHRANRLYELWGETYEVSSAKETAEQTLRGLEGRLYRLLALMDTPLYRNTPRRAQVSPMLRMTNILSNDDHYRGVARLWQAWSDYAVARPLTPAQVYQRHQDLQRAYVAWCALLVVRACDQLRVEPVDDDVDTRVAPGCEIALQRGVHLAWSRDGVLTLSRDDRPVVRFIPIVHAIESAERASLKERLAPLIESVAGQEPWAVVLHPATPGSARHPALAGVGNPPFPGARGAVDFIRVSPFSLDSVERVARAIRWAMLAPSMLEYPPVVEGIAHEIVEKYPSHFRRDGSSRWTLVAPPRGLDMDRLVDEAKRACDRLTAERNRVDEEIRSTRGDRRALRDLNLRKKALLEPLRDAEARVRALEASARALETARRKIEAIAECPACGHQGQLTPRDGRCFEARCSQGCGAKWELRHDPMSESRVPVFLPGGLRGRWWDQIGSTAQVDEVLGADVLAAPLGGSTGNLRFATPRKTPLGEVGQLLVDEPATVGQRD